MSFLLLCAKQASPSSPSAVKKEKNPIRRLRGIPGPGMRELLSWTLFPD